MFELAEHGVGMGVQWLRLGLEAAAAAAPPAPRAAREPP